MYQIHVSPPSGPEVSTSTVLGCNDRSQLNQHCAGSSDQIHRLKGWHTGLLIMTACCFVCVSFSDAAATAAAAPVFSPGTGSYTSTQSVTITDATPGVTIYYTTNGTTPTTSSTIYKAGPIMVSNSETLRAIAIATNYSPSAVAWAGYYFPTAKPTFGLASGTYATPQMVTITDATPGATIYFTSDRSWPSKTSAIYTSPLTVSSTETIKALALAPGDTTSPLGEASYTILAHKVDLSWDAPSSSPAPIEGYKVYRSTGSSSTYQLLNSSIDTQTTYVDSTVQSGLIYHYYVESVDSSGKQSAPSNLASVTIPSS